MTNKVVSNNLDKSIEQLESIKKEILQVGMETMKVAQGQLLTSDFIVVGAIKRSQSVSSGIVMHIKEKNMTCARALLRLQLDTVLRFSALNIVDNIQDLAKHILSGENLTKFKCRDGNQLRDGYLVEKLEPEFPWIRDVYKNTSGYIHFSGSYIYDSVATMDEETREMTLLINDTDDRFPESSWVEIINCSIHCILILKGMILAYRSLKESSISNHKNKKREKKRY